MNRAELLRVNDIVYLEEISEPERPGRLVPWLVDSMENGLIRVTYPDNIGWSHGYIKEDAKIKQYKGGWALVPDATFKEGF